MAEVLSAATGLTASGSELLYPNTAMWAEQLGVDRKMSVPRTKQPPDASDPGSKKAGRGRRESVEAAFVGDHGPAAAPPAQVTPVVPEPVNFRAADRQGRQAFLVAASMLFLSSIAIQAKVFSAGIWTTTAVRQRDRRRKRKAAYCAVLPERRRCVWTFGVCGACGASRGQVCLVASTVMLFAMVRRYRGRRADERAVLAAYADASWYY